MLIHLTLPQLKIQREKNMYGDESNGVVRNNSNVNNDYNTSTSENNIYSMRPSSFDRDAAQFSWWKRKIYIHIIGVDNELWDIIDDGVEFEVDT